MVADRGFPESKPALIREKNVGAESNLACLQSLENLSEMSPEYPGPHMAGHPAGLAAISGGEKQIAAVSVPPTRESGDLQQRAELCADPASPDPRRVSVSAIH